MPLRLHPTLGISATDRHPSQAAHCTRCTRRATHTAVQHMPAVQATQHMQLEGGQERTCTGVNFSVLGSCDLLRHSLCNACEVRGGDLVKLREACTPAS